MDRYVVWVSTAPLAQTAEELGYDSIWLFDHFHTVPVPTQEVTFECWTSTAALARDTKHVRIVQIVTCNSYRNPALLAKMASIMDVHLFSKRMSQVANTVTFRVRYQQLSTAVPSPFQALAVR